MDRTRFLVIGAGITGLAFADRIATDDYLVVEAAEAIGGYCRTVRRDGFVWDYSGHFFHFRHPEIERELVSRMGSDAVVRVARDSRIYWGDRLIDFPFQNNIHQLSQPEFIECLCDLYFREETAPRNFQEMLYAGFGRAIADKFLIPYNEKVYATDLSTLDVDAMGRFFPHASVRDVIAHFRHPRSAGYNVTFTYPRGGAIQYVEALASGVRRDRISIGEPVVRIDLLRKVAVTDRREIAFDYAVSSMPFSRLLAITGLPWDPRMYRWNKVLVFNIGFDRKGPAGIHWIYVPQRDVIFYRVGFYDNILGTDRMSLYVEIGYPQDSQLSDAEVERARRRVLEDLARCGIVDGHRPIAWHAVVLDPAYVHIATETIRDVQEKKRALEQYGVYSVGRYGSWTYCSIEDNIVEARALADSFNAPGVEREA